MSGRRDRLRAAEMGTGESAARALNTLHQALYERLERLEASGSAAAPAWQTLALSGGFVNMGGLFAVAAYYLDAAGRLFLKGVIGHVAGCVSGTVFATLSPGLRPAETQRFAVTGTAATFQSVSITASGAMSVELAVAAGGTCDLAINFRAEK